ncbi:MAG TPA: sensor histidine kinase [Rhizomicrobium sp.]|nr:sensor histidine kinase [Rhizomicrobium sp.]
MTREPGWTLRQRLQAIITVALLPVVLVSIFQGVARARMDIAAVHDKLVQSARSAATGDQDLLASADQILRAVGSLSDVRQIGGNCDGVLADTLIGVRYFSNLSRIDEHGRVVCSALALAKGVDVSGDRIFQQARKSDAMAVSEELQSPIINRPVIAAMLALHKPDGSFDGAVGITLDVHWIDYMLHNGSVPQGAVVAVFDRVGRVIATNRPKIARLIVAAALKGGANDDSSLYAADTGGSNWHFSTAALTGGTILVAFAMPENRLFGPTYLHVGIDFLLPILMILVAWIAIWLTTDRQVTQWILYLRRIAAAYRSGHYAIRPDLAEAPAEFKLLGDALSEMAEGIQDRDRRLREAVDLKTILIKEIHHRVKNNLQIVMSLLSIQAGQVKDKAARDALVQAQTRINALALVHRILNELENQSVLDLKQLLEELAHQIAGGMGSENVRIDVRVPSRVVSGSVAVAVALFTVEALTNIFKHAFPLAAAGTIRITLENLPAGKLKLAIADDGIGFVMDDTGKSVGSRLIKTFGQQLGGMSSVRSAAGRGTIVELEFPDPDAVDESAGAPAAAASPGGESDLRQVSAGG